nr:hypothetical protein [Tanacetum cinerariifolium]
VDEQTKGREESEGDKTDESGQEVKESDEGDDEATESDRESEDEETKEQEEESFDPIPRTPEDDKDDDNNEEDQGLRIGEEERMQEEEDAEELYRDVDINLGWGLQVSQEIEDTHVILTPTQSDAQQESSSTSSFMTNLLNPITDPASQLPTPPTQIPSLDLQSLPTFASVFRFEDKVKSLKDNFSNISGIVNQYMNQQMPEAVQKAMQTQTNQLQDSIQRENDEFLKTIDENMKNIIKEQAEVLTRSSHSSRTSYAVAADLSEMELKKILIEKMEGNKREDDDHEGPSAGLDRGSKRQREGGEHASASTLSEPATGSAGRSTTGSQSRQLSASESAFAEEPVQPTCQMEEPSHPVFETAAQGNAQSWITTLAKQTDAHSLFNKLLDTPIDFSNFIMNRLGVNTLTPKLLVGPTYELIRGSCNSLTELEYHLEEVYKATTDQLDWVNPEGANKLWQARPLGSFSLAVETSAVLWRRVEDLQLGVESYQKRLNLTKPDTYRSDLKRREAYTAHSNPRGFIYQNKYKKNRLIRIDELHKFSNGTLNDVCNALDDRLKGIRMQYLPTTIWRRGDKARAAAMIQAIDKMLKTRRLMRSLERFVGGRHYEGDFRMLQRTI